jgi:hypothetical protein
MSSSKKQLKSLPLNTAYLRGKRYENEKLKQGGTGSNQHKSEQSGKIYHSAKNS